ncbi:ER membrane protein complex subunit 1-like isoform X2 [Lineus longissimus]|uniref:ER membrane protein complex subunit 1-like isoform X2 n=1 Tax=Lineus longissimus TaxID=88925 RepID=UPI002B4F920A
MAAPENFDFYKFVLITLAISSPLCNCLFEDQIGKFDWRHQYVGQAEFVYFDQSSQSGRHIMVGTHQNVVASLSARNGHILWRQILESGDAGKISDLIQTANSIVCLTGGGSHVRNYLSQTGHLLWETSFNTPVEKRSTIEVFSRDHNGDSLLVLHENRLAMLETEEGKEIWNIDLPNSDNVAYLYVDVNGKDIAVAGVSPGNQVAILTYTSSGKMVSQMTVPAPWIAKDTSCQMVGAKSFACVASSAIYTIKISGKNAFTKTTFQDLGLPDGDRPQLTSHLKEMNRDGASMLVLKLTSMQHAVISLQGEKVTLAKEPFEASAVQFIRHDDDNDVLLSSVRKSQDSVLLTGYSLTSKTELSEFTQRLMLPGHHGNPTKLYSLGFRKRDGSTGYRYLIISEDHAITLMQQSGKAVWNREEALASVLSVEMVDLPVSENEAKMEDEFGKKEDDMFVMLFKRITTQLSQLKGFIMHLQDRFLKGQKEVQDIAEAEEEYPMESIDLTRDNFNLHKMILLTSAAGKVYGMYSNTGHLVWKNFLPNMAPFSKFGKTSLPVFIQRTTAHFPHAPQAAVLGKHKETGNGYLYVFNPITGEEVEKKHDLGFKVSQVMPHSQVDERFLKGVIFLDDKLKVHVYPKTLEPQVHKVADSLFMFTTDADKAVLSGYGMMVKNQELQALSLWNVNLLGENQKITNVVAKRLAEHVHSQGRVLGDRSVLYKYLNPNMVVVTTQGEELTQKTPFGFLNVYLIDVVNGNIIFHANHKKVLGPVHVVHSENWVVYNYWNQGKRRNEITVLELYEGNKQSNATTFSSLSPPPTPLVMRQSYIFPTSLTTMSVTITEKGISNKHIMIALSMGGIFEMSKMFLDPRRPVSPTPEHREEGIIPYIPELPLQTEAFVNYNHSVFNIRGIHTAPAGLESTSLVLAYGLDLFFTRVFPSKMFDMLKEDFDYLFIGSVVGAMILASIITQKLASRKALNRNWK